MANKQQSNNKNYKGKNKRPNTRGRGKGRNGNKEMEVNIEDASVNKADMPHVKTDSSKDNDPSWYTHIYPLVNDIANFNYNIPVGTPFNPLSNVSSVYLDTETTYGINKGTTTGKVVP